MKIRCCAHYVLVPSRRVVLDLASLVDGQVCWHAESGWEVLAAHLDKPQPVTVEQMALLGRVDSAQWQDASDFADQTDVLQGLIDCGLLLTQPIQQPAASHADEQVRQGHWYGLSAVYARHGRWHAGDVVEAMDTPGLANARTLRRLLGPAPASTRDAGVLTQSIGLPTGTATALGNLLQRRVTCRNFADGQVLSLEALGAVLGLTFAAQGQARVEQDMDFLKRSSPSAGGLHALETYLLVQQVEGLVPGWYHYRPLDHAIVPLADPQGAGPGQALSLLAGQHWFASAPVLVVLAARYQRAFWKYRAHAKAWRALLLEAGHFSQTLYLAATERQLGAFVTCAINEPVAEAALQVDPLETGILTVCGLGHRGEDMKVAELDPAGAIWQPAGA